MQEPKVQTAQTAQTAQTNGTTGTAPSDEAVDMGAFVDEMVGHRGEVPGVTEGMDPTQQQILENQFRQDTRFMMEDIKSAIKEVSPDATLADIQKFARAFVQGDALAQWQAAQGAARKEAEQEENEEETKELRIEGAGSGTKGTEKTLPSTPGEAALMVADAFRS